MRIRSFTGILILGLTILQGCKYISEKHVTLQGSFTSLSAAKLYIFHILPAGKPVCDSVITDDAGNFSISFPLKEAGYFVLQRAADDGITLVLAPGETVTVKGDGKALRSTYTVEGSIDSRVFAAYQKFTSANLARVDSLSRIFAESRSHPNFLSVKKTLDSGYMTIFTNQKEKVIAFAGSHVNSLASLLAVSANFGPNPLLSEQTHPVLFLKIDSALMHTYPGNSLVTTFHLRMQEFKTKTADLKAHDKLLEPGMPAPEIILPNAAGREIKLSSLHGKLRLIYFWSYWNALCRQTNINLTTVYNQYKDQGFEIFAVALDPEASQWKKAYMLDKAYWMQLIDTKGLGSEYCKTYALRALPKMILIGKNGRIIAVNPGPEDLKILIKSNL